MTAEGFIGACCVLNAGKKEILIDATDIPMLGRYSWHATAIHDSCGGSRKYAQCSSKKYQAYGLLHRHLLSAEPGVSVDHINGNGLDNRRRNLRLCTHAENMRNRKIGKNNTTGFKGVSREGRGFKASIAAGRVKRRLGVFDTAEEAHAAYCAAAAELHGEFARFE